MQHQAVVAFFLIENSQAMTTLWPDLRDRYLPEFNTKFAFANPAAPITTFVSESLPASDGRFSMMPRQYQTLQSGLDDVKFNWDPQNRLSVEKIWSDADYLATTDFQGQPIARHLVIVAASTPFDDSNGADPTAYNNGNTRWHQLAVKLSQYNIQCHLVISPHQDMWPLATMFEETLRLQNSVEEPPPFPVDFNQVVFRLAARPQFFPTAVPQPIVSTHRILPRRNYSFPLASHTTIEDNMFGPTASGEPANPPSLVSQLQQVHGLTKKKVYGTKPVHKPFVRDERSHMEPPNVPAPLVLPSLKTSPKPGGGGRALSTSKAARINRLAQSSPTEMQGRRPGLPRRNSRMSSPETDMQQSPSTYMPSPVSPTSGLTNMFIQPAPIVPTAHPETILGQSWGSGLNQPLLPSLSQASLPLRYPPTLPQSGAENGMQSTEGPFPVTVPSRPNTHYEYFSSSMTLHRRRASNGGNPSPSRRLPRRSSCPSDEEPFTFNAEYVAATAAMFQAEILPSYPDLQPAFSEDIQPPRRAFYIAQAESGPPSPSSSYDPGELYVAAERNDLQAESSSQVTKYPVPSAGSPGLSYATSYSPGSSSSLTGWAG